MEEVNIQIVELRSNSQSRDSFGSNNNSNQESISEESNIRVSDNNNLRGPGDIESFTEKSFSHSED